MTDLELVRSILAGRRELFALVVDRHKDLVLSVLYQDSPAYSGEIEDLAQDVFLKIFRGLPQYRGESSLSTWIYRIALNRRRDHERAKRPAALDLAPLADQLPDSAEAATEEAALAAIDRTALRESLAALPEIYRQPLYLYHYRGLSYGEIGRRLGLPAKTVETRLYRAKKILREQLMSKEAAPECATR